jgi:hypothetical protein
LKLEGANEAIIRVKDSIKASVSFFKFTTCAARGFTAMKGTGKLANFYKVLAERQKFSKAQNQIFN